MSVAGVVLAVAAGAVAAAHLPGVLGPAVGDGGGEFQPAEGVEAVSARRPGRGMEPHGELRGGGAGSRRASGLAGALGSGVREARDGGGCGQGPVLRAWNSLYPRGSGGDEGLCRAGRDAADPGARVGIGVPSACAGFVGGGPAAAPGTDRPRPGSRQQAAPGPFPATSRACLRHSGSESFSIAGLPLVFKSVFPAGTALGSLVAFSQTPL